MTRWKITLEYDGTHFCGWQKQAHNQISVQQVLENALQKFSGEIVTPHVAGRTDSGVHAKAQVAHFDLMKDTNADTVRDALNFHVRPHKIVVLKATSMPSTFHARFDALSRSYKYYIVNRRAPLALQADYAWHIHKPLDVSRMQEASRLLIGKHDFSTFRAQFCQANSPLRTLDQLDITSDNETIVFSTRARSFLYHQVRNMVGTLSLVGTGQWTLDTFRTAFAACDRQAGGPTAPSHGLFFWDVLYP